MIAALMLAAAVLAPRPACAQSGIAQVAAEATIYEKPSDTNGGGYDNICVGNLDGFIITRRAFARFDLPAIPAGSVITRVVYELTQVRVRHMGSGSPKAATLELRRVEGSWDEGGGVRVTTSCGGGDDVPGVNWDNAPGVQAGASATAPLPAFGTTVTFDTDIGSANDGLIADVQAWVDDPAVNFGWEYRISEEDELDNARLLSPGSITVYWVAQLEFEDGFESP